MLDLFTPGGVMPSRHRKLIGTSALPGANTYDPSRVSLNFDNRYFSFDVRHCLIFGLPWL